MKSSQNDSQVKFLSKELVTSPSVGNNQPLLRDVGLPPPLPPLKKKRKFRESKLIRAKTYKSLFSIKKKAKASCFKSAVFGNIHDFINTEQNVHTFSTIIC